MGNCQAAEAATVVIQHPVSNKIERIYWSVSAHEVMTSNPGHYVALVVVSPTMKNENGMPLKQLKLLRPDDTLLIGQVYRLINFEDVLKEFAAKKCVKLGKMLKEKGGLGLEKKKRDISVKQSSIKGEQEACGLESHLGVGGGSSNGRGVGGGGSRGVMGRHGGGQWKPALQSIAETGT